MEDRIISKSVMDTFDEVYYSKYKVIFNYCYYNIKFDKNDAEDITNDVFMALYCIWENFSPKNDLNISKWLYKTAYNMVLNHNKKKRHYINAIDYDEIISEGNTEFIDELSNNNISEWEDNENYKRRAKDIKQILTPSQYRLFELSVIEGYSNLEIAKILCMKENTVKVTMHRIRTKLKKLLKK